MSASAKKKRSKKTEADDRYSRVNFTLPNGMREYVEATALLEDRTVSGVMRKAIEALAAERGEEEKLKKLCSA